eukprot:scaffold840_cov265-Pinguiococcus_pyrenoidosus.AAC.5
MLSSRGGVPPRPFTMRTMRLPLGRSIGDPRGSSVPRMWPTSTPARPSAVFRWTKSKGKRKKEKGKRKKEKVRLCANSWSPANPSSAPVFHDRAGRASWNQPAFAIGMVLAPGSPWIPRPISRMPGSSNRVLRAAPGTVQPVNAAPIVPSAWLTSVAAACTCVWIAAFSARFPTLTHDRQDSNHNERPNSPDQEMLP